MKTMADKKQKFKCGYCGKEFAREATVATHKCAKRDRYNIRDTREAKIALDIWLRFRKYCRMPHKKSLQPYDAFVASTEFSGFYDFAKYIIEKQPVEADKFIDYLLRNSIPLRDWTTETTYVTWVQHILRTEPMDRAIQRSIESIQSWSDTTGNEWTEFFSAVSPQRALLLIESGRISPWCIYASSTRHELLERFSDEEFTHIFKYIDPHVWSAKQVKFKDDFSNVTEIFKAYGL